MTFTPPIRRRNYGKGHGYVDANGLKIPGVTSIISDGIPKPALLKWAGDVTAEYAVDCWDELADMAPSVRLKTLKGARYANTDTAANKGTVIHRLAAELVMGRQVQVPDLLAGYVESYVRFLDEHDVEPVLVEATVVSHKHGYAGTLDLIDGHRLLDLKSSRSGIFGETALQLAAYRYADAYVDERGDEHPMPHIDWTGAVHIRADGYSLVPVEAGPEQFRAFLYVQQVARFVADSRSLVGGPVESPTSSTYRLTRLDEQ